MHDTVSSSASFPRRLALLLAGWALISLAISGILRANLGAGPFDVLNTAISTRLDIAVGTASWISTSCVLVLAVLLGAKPGAATFAGMFVIGQGVNSLLLVIPQPVSVVLRAGMLLLAVLLLCLGVTFVVVSELGRGAIDLLMHAVQNRGTSIVTARVVFEVTAALAGVIAGGSAGFATLLIAVCLGPTLHRTMQVVAPRITPLL